MAINVLGVVTAASPGFGENNTVFTINPPVGTTKIVLLAENIRFNPPRTISSVTFSTSQSLTSRYAVNNNSPYVRLEAWTLDNPANVSSSIDVAWDGAVRAAVAVLYLDGTTAGGPTLTAFLSSSSNPNTLAISSSVGGLVISAYAIDAGDTTTIAADAGTEQANLIGSPGASGTSSRLGVVTRPGTGSPISTTWTRTGTGEEALQIALSFDELATPRLIINPALLGVGGNSPVIMGTNQASPTVFR